MYDIVINGLKIFAFHGVKPLEKENGQDFLIDLLLKVDVDMKSLEDNISNTVNYSDVVRLISSEMSSKSYDLIESVAYNIEKAIYDKFESVKGINITLKKPQAPIKAEFEFVAVCMESKRSDFYG